MSLLDDAKDWATTELITEVASNIDMALDDLRDLAKTAELRDELWAAAKDLSEATANHRTYNTGTTTGLHAVALTTMIIVCDRVAETET